MRYFEIVRPRHILSDTGLKEPTAGERRIDGLNSGGLQRPRCNLAGAQDLLNRQLRRRHL